MRLIAVLNANILAVPFWISLAALLIALALEWLKRGFLAKHASRIFLYSALIVFAYLLYIAFLQFQAFQRGPLGLTLGTKDTFLWFLGYVRLHYWNVYLVSFPAAILFALIGGWFNKKYAERFFEKEELYLIATGILLTGYPGFIFYIPLVLLLSSAVSAIFLKHGERMPLYHFWMPTAIAVLLAIQLWAGSQVWWGSFRF
jgi:hypothetical protein